MMKNIILSMIFVALTSVSAYSGNFHISEGTVLRHNVDNALLNYQGEYLQVHDERGNTYQLRLNQWGGNCRVGNITSDRYGDSTSVSICRGSRTVSAVSQTVTSMPAYGKKYISVGQQMLTQRYATALSDAKVGAQYGLRGNPNAPHQRIQPLRVDQNTMYGMTPKQFEEYSRRLDWANNYHGRVIQNDQSAAEAAVRWTSGGYNENYRQRQIPDAVSGGIADTIRRAFGSINFQ